MLPPGASEGQRELSKDCPLLQQAFHFHISVKQLCVSQRPFLSVLKGIVNATAQADSSCLRMALSLRAPFSLC